MTKEVDSSEKPVGFRSRVIALLLGFWYLMWMAAILMEATNIPGAIAAAVVFVAAVVIMVVMTIFGMKAYAQRGPSHQFRLSSLFLLIVPLSIYLAGIRAVLGQFARENLGLLTYLMIVLASLGFMVFSTVILLWTAEALMWFAAGAVKAFREGQAEAESDS